MYILYYVKIWSTGENDTFFEKQNSDIVFNVFKFCNQQRNEIIGCNATFDYSHCIIFKQRHGLMNRVEVEQLGKIQNQLNGVDCCH